MPAGEDGHILALIHHVCLANHERLVGIGEIGHGRTAEAKVHRAVPFGGGDGGLLGLVVVAGHHDGHSGKGAHQGHVFHRLVRGAVLAEGDAGVGGSYLHVGVAIGNFLAELVIDAAGHEFGEGADERHLAGYGETGGGTDHIGLGNAALDESVGELCGESVHLQRTLEVRGHSNDPAVLRSRFGYQPYPGLCIFSF